MLVYLVKDSSEIPFETYSTETKITLNSPNFKHLYTISNILLHYHFSIYLISTLFEHMECSIDFKDIFL